jgi:hypothetical protein
MKSFKQYITESITSYADQIKNVLVAAAQEHGFDDKNLQLHRAHGTHNRLLQSNGPFDFAIQNKEYSGRDKYSDADLITRYTFDIPGLNVKIHDPRVEMTVKTRTNPYKLPHNLLDSGDNEHEIDFNFGHMYGSHPTLGPLQRSDVMGKVFSGVMRGLVHYTIHNNVDPKRERFTFYPFAGPHGDDPIITSSGKERKITQKEQKERVYGHIMKSLMDLHKQLRS